MQIYSNLHVNVNQFGFSFFQLQTQCQKDEVVLLPKKFGHPCSRLSVASPASFCPSNKWKSHVIQVSWNPRQQRASQTICCWSLNYRKSRNSGWNQAQRHGEQWHSTTLLAASQDVAWRSYRLYLASLSVSEKRKTELPWRLKTHPSGFR